MLVQAAATAGSTTAAVVAIACDGTATCEGEVTTAGSEADGTCTAAALADGDACDPTATTTLCSSGGCTVTDAAVSTTVGTCDATAEAIADGATGGACAIAVTGVTAVDCTVSGDTCSTATATDGAAGICQAADGTPATATDGAAAGANGGACNAAVTEVTAIDCTVTTDTCTNSICTAAAGGDDDADADDDSPAALFYGLSMVTGAIAYLL